MMDLVIRGGTVIDGNGGTPYAADVGVSDGRIAAIGDVAPGREEIDARGLMVTPGFVDIHTHYDGQVTWSETLAPSSSHGVTTVVIGNCGVGFAPCRPDDRAALINVMEGVEDIPEAVMARGLPWNWESFPEFMDALDARSWDIDVAVYVPHSPIRVYVMGQRGLDREAATQDDIARMAALVTEGLKAGAVGFATSRTMVHRRGDGEHIPSFHAATEELASIAGAVGRLGRGVLQMIPNLDSADYDLDVGLLQRMATESQRPVTYSLAQWGSDRTGWKRTIEAMRGYNAARGTRLHAQVFPRPMGVICGLDTSFHPFSACPSYAPLAALPLAERVAALRAPAMRARLLTEEQSGEPLAGMNALMRNFDAIYVLDSLPDYEPGADRTVAALAAERGIAPVDMAYEWLLRDEGRALLFAPFSNYCDGNLDAALAMMRDPESVIGLGDGGAHYGLISDSSYPTTLLTFWTRDRKGERVSLPWAIKALSAENADFLGLADRGRLKVGLKADINVIDHASLRLHSPRAAYDLPGGGRRLMQDAEGYVTTIVNGVVIQRDGQPTGARPGRLVRGGRD
ncbi:N-acyl-D-amino-acid deacylase family protein [Sphingobium aromaticiconvertens]|uniref:N-acyl-D-amino-acid deacylase family protein n=1 Tax=Sphingobium aromaticiconvertens TaxID=365341 RepID=UPI003015F058